MTMRVMWSLLAAVLWTVGLQAQESGNKERLQVGIKESPPFTIKKQDGSWSGISVDLWEQIAERQGLEYEWVEQPLAELLKGVQNGALDVGIAAITINSERETKLDFTHGYFTSELSIATVEGGGGGWALAQALLSPGFLKTVLGLVMLLLVVGFGLWLAERKQNQEQFGGSAPHGIGAAFWWAAVTMTTVGYGDKAPQTFLGRIIALVWMFAALVVISGFIAGMSSALTVGNLSAKVTGPNDLYNAKVGTVEGSTSAVYLEEKGVRAQTFETVEDAWSQLLNQQIDAFVYDAPILRYTVNKEGLERVKVLPGGFERQQYGIALPDGSTWRESFNRTLLEITQSNDWHEVTEQYLGQ